jgi:hypothetical protein
MISGRSDSHYIGTLPSLLSFIAKSKRAEPVNPTSKQSTILFWRLRSMFEIDTCSTGQARSTSNELAYIEQ